MDRLVQNLLLALAVSCAEDARRLPHFRWHAGARDQVDTHAVSHWQGEWLSDLRKIRIRAVRKVWRRYLLGKIGKNPLIIDEYTGQDRLANTDDELEDGGWDADLNYRNKLWKLQLARPHPDGYRSRPLTAVICMIGRPPPCRCGLHSMGSGVFSS